MGLDMYLTGKQYVSTYDHKPKDVQLQMMLKTVLKKWNMGNDKKQIDYPVQYIEFSLMQWRKSNQIHEWFVQTVQKGKDDCGSYYVDEDDCKELLKICKIVLENKGNDKKILELLPPQSGCFFGSTDLDEYYFEDIKETAEVLQNILDKDLHSELEVYYHSSW
jgi:hypothetical protein